MKRSLAVLVGICLALSAQGAAEDTLLLIRETTDARGQPNLVLERIQADGSGRSVVFNSDVQENPEPIPFPRWQRSPDVSPLGKKIVLRRSWTVSAMNWDGTDAVNLTPYGREWFDPRWSPDGKKIALCSDSRDLAEILVMNHDGSDLRNITWKARSNERSPDWSPDGRKLVFISDRNGKSELFTMNAADGTEQVRVLSLDGDIREPAWGAHNRIAFALQKPDGNAALFTVDPDGANLKQLTDGTSWDGQVAWDASGKRLAFVSNRGGDADIWILDVASGALHNVTRNPDHNELFPAWVPKQLADQAPAIAATAGKATNTAGLQLPRPRLLFRAEELPAIREKFAQEPYVPVWQSFLANCDSLLDPKSKPAQAVETAIQAIKDNPSKGLYDRSGWITPVFDLAFARQVTGDRKYGVRAAAWLIAVAAEYAKWHQAMVSEYPVACAYDWLHDLFAPDDLRLLTGLLQHTATQSYQHLIDYYFGETRAIEGNFATHSAGSVGPLFLALSGESGSDAAWLSAAARLTSINLNTWIGKAGDAAEGTSYFNFPVALLMPFMISLKINNLYPETRDSNLQRFADWYAVVNAGGTLPAIGDSDGGSITFPVGLLQLYPESVAAHKLWNSVARAGKPAAEVLSLLWFVPSENKPQDYTGFPKTAYFDTQNYQVFRSGYSENSRLLTFTLTAGGHAHRECGAIALNAFGQKLLIDPGQSVSAADCHSQLLINGQGRFINYESANAPRERISPIQAEPFAAAATVNMIPAFASRESSTHSAPGYTIPGPGMKLARGNRVLVMVGDDTTVVPPYYLVFDDVRVKAQASLYEQLYIGDADMVAQDQGNGAFVYRKRFSGPWLAPVSGAKGDAALEFAIPEAGNYQVWVYMKQNPDTDRTGSFAFRLGEATYNSTVAFRGNRANCWQWAAAVFGEGGRADPEATRRRSSGEPVVSTVTLAAGTQTLRVLPRDTIFARVALIPEAQAKVFQGWGDLPAGALVSAPAEAVVTGAAWKLHPPDRPAAELLVASLNTDPVNVVKDAFSFNTRFHNQQFITLPRTKLVKRQPDANFLTLLYPCLPAMEQPSIRLDKVGAVITWQKAVDTVQATAAGVTVHRRHADGKDEVFRFPRPVE